MPILMPDFKHIFIDCQASRFHNSLLHLNLLLQPIENLLCCLHLPNYINGYNSYIMAIRATINFCDSQEFKLSHLAINSIAF